MIDYTDKAKQIVAHVNNIKQRNELKTYEDRQDYNYTSYAWALKILKGSNNEQFSKG